MAVAGTPLARAGRDVRGVLRVDGNGARKELLRVPDLFGAVCGWRRGDRELAGKSRGMDARGGSRGHSALCNSGAATGYVDVASGSFAGVSKRDRIQACEGGGAPRSVTAAARGGPVWLAGISGGCC